MVADRMFSLLPPFAAPLHLQLYNLPEEEVVGPETLSRLHQANIDFESWYQEWDRIFGASLSLQTIAPDVSLNDFSFSFLL